jgi:hypothetical protein
MESESGIGISGDCALTVFVVRRPQWVEREHSRIHGIRSRVSSVR